MPRPPKNLEGKRFGPFVVLQRAGSGSAGHHVTWEVECVDCGDKSVKTSANLQRAKRCGRCGFRKDRVGHRSGFLRVTEFSHSNNWKAYWRCECDCGQQVTLPASALAGPKANLSCGRCELTRRRVSDDTRVRARVLIDYKTGAARRDLAWELSDDQAWALVRGICHWCGGAPESRKLWETDQRSRTIEYALNGIDRLDSSEGYATRNVVTSCTQCNLAKRQLRPHEFLEHVAEIVNYQNRSNRPEKSINAVGGQ